jgi:Rrf2 family protein
VKGEAIAAAQHIPSKYLENILADLRSAGLLRSQRGSSGGYRLARSAESISVADVIRAVEGPLATVRGEPAEELEYLGSAASLQQLWIAVRAALRGVLEQTTIADVAAGRLPAEIRALAEDPESWETTAQRSVRTLLGGED